jgi:chaperone modulatory protein CbpM
VEHEREAAWLTEECEFSISQLAEITGLTEDELREFVDYGAITPVDPAAARWSFTGRSLITVRSACRLRADFELEPHGVALAISLLDRIRELEREIASLRAKMPHRL